MLSKLFIQGFRNISQANLSDLRRVNVFVGENGSGKTSILESIYALGSTRSFRTRKWQALIQHGQEAFVVFGELQKKTGLQRLGVKRQRGVSGPQVRLGGESLKTIGELAGILPLQLIDSASFRLLEGPPELRRQLLDWSVFHVEQSRFVLLWQRYRRALEQRNSLLRMGNASFSALEPWTRAMIEAGEQVDLWRKQQFSKLIPIIDSVYANINEAASSPVGLSYQYYAGWDSAKLSLGEALERSYNTDRERGFTRYGPHRADIRVKAEGKSAVEVLSRGQMKTVVCCLRLAQATLLQQYGIKSVFLVDDLPAELDPFRRQKLTAELLKLDVQLFFTGLEESDFSGCFSDIADQDIAMFHVKHGYVHRFKQ